MLLSWRHEHGRKPVTDPSAPQQSSYEYLLDVLMPCAAGGEAEARAGRPPRPAHHNEPNAEPLVLPLRLSSVVAISALRLHLPPDLSGASGRRVALGAMRQALSERRLGTDGEVERRARVAASRESRLGWAVAPAAPPLTARP